MAKQKEQPPVVEVVAPVTFIKPGWVEADPVTGCVVCGQNTGSFVEVAGAARAHAECAAARPDVISKVKARA